MSIETSVSEGTEVFYCPRCEYFFRLKIHNIKPYLIRKKCPNCGNDNILLVKTVFIRMRHDFHKFMQKVEKVREYIDKIVLKIEQIINLISKDEARHYFDKNGYVSEVMDIYTNIGILIERLEDELTQFILEFRKASKRILIDDRTAKLSLINNLLEEFNSRLHDYAYGIKQIAKRVMRTQKELQKSLNVIRAINQHENFKAIEVLEIFFTEDKVIVITSMHIYVLNPTKMNVERRININEFVIVSHCKRFFTNGICIELLNGKKYFLKTEPDVAEKAISSIDELRSKTIYESSYSNIETKYKVLKPNTRSIRDRVFQLKSQIIDTITELKKGIASALNLREETKQREFQSNYNSKNASVIKELLKDLDAKYNQGLISFEDYMKFKRFLLTQLYDSNNKMGTEDALGGFRDNPF